MNTANRKWRVARGERQGNRRWGRMVVLSLFIPLAIGCSLLAAFKDNGWGTRPAGMGGAYTALANDASGPLYNPAGSGRLENREFSFMYAKPYVGLDLNAGSDGTTSLGMNYLSWVSPFRPWGSFGFSWANFDVGGLYQENTVTLTYARSVHELFPWEGVPPLYGGLNIKSMSNKFRLDDRTRQTEATSSRSPFQNGTSQNVFAFDAGVQIRPLDRVWLGFSGKNLNAPDIGLAEKETVPREYRLGGAWLAGDVGLLEDLTPVVEISYRKPSQNDADLRTYFGIESWFNFHTYAVRLGGNDREVTLGGSWNRHFSRFSLQLDYGLIWSTTIDDNSGTHRFSFTLRQAVPSLQEGFEKAAETIENKNGSVEPPEPNLSVWPELTPRAPEEKGPYRPPRGYPEEPSSEDGDFLLKRSHPRR